MIWLEVSAFSIMALLSIFGGNLIARAESGLDGGVVGWGIAEFFGLLLKPLPDGLENGLRVVLLFLFGRPGYFIWFSADGACNPEAGSVDRWRAAGRCGAI